MSLASSPKNVTSNPFQGLESSPNEFKSSIRRTVAIWVTILALLPVILVVVINILQSRAAISEQALSQIQTAAKNSSNQLIQINVALQSVLEKMLASEATSNAIYTLLSAETSDEAAQSNANIELVIFLQSNREKENARIDEVLIFDNDGLVRSSTNRDWRNQNFLETPAIKGLLGTDKTIAVFNPSPLYRNELIFFSSKTITDSSGAQIGTLVVTANSTIPVNTITTAQTAFSGTRAYFVTSDNFVIRLDDTSRLIPVAIPKSFEPNLQALLTPQGQRQSYTSHDNVNVLGVGIWMPDISLGMLIESREDAVFKIVNSSIPMSLILIGAAMLLSLVGVFLGINRLFRPLTDLAQKGNLILSGQSSVIERSSKTAGAERGDEIGAIANTFDYLTGQIKDLEETFQKQIEQRTQTMRTASEVVRQATSTTRRQELVTRTCQSLVEKFGFSFASIFTLDESQSYAVLQGVSQIEQQPKIPDNYRVNVAADTLVGWVSMNNKIRIVQNFETEPAFRSPLTTSSTRSEIAIPIQSASDTNDISGVLSIQSGDADRFDVDTVGVLENLAAQIAAGLQNIQVFEATELKLSELNLLYSTSRQIAQSQSEKEMMQILSAALAKTDYVSGVFSVEAFYLSVLGIIDPRSPNITSAQGITLPLQKIGQRVERNSMVLVEYLTQPTEYDNLLSFFSRRGCHSAALFFVFNQESLSKILVVGSRDLSPLQEEKLAPFFNLVEVMSTALEHFQVLGTLELRLGELQTLAQVSKAISAETDLDQLYRILHTEILNAFGSDVHFLIATYDEKTSMINIPYMYDEGQLVPVEPFPLGQGMTSILIRNREPLMLVKDTERKAAELGAKIIGKSAKSWLGVPLIVGGQVLGAMVLQDTDHEERFNENDLRLMVTLSSPVANAIRNAQLLSEMQAALHAYDQERYLLNTLLDNIPDLIYFKNPDGQFIRASQSTIAAYGLNSADEIQNKTISEIYPDSSDIASVVDLEEEIIREGQPRLNEIIQRNPNEVHQTWTLVSKIPLFDKENKAVGLLGIESDITSLKTTEQLAQRRAEQLLTAAEIARETTTELNVEQILSRSVNLIRERFGFYHASIFLLDPLKEYAILRESTGEVGRLMKERQHRLAVGSQSIVGRTTSTRKPLVINDVTQDTNYFANPLLPDTRSELAIPLLAGNELLGAIDVQSNRLNAFSDEDISILQILADQLAIAVLNANLFAEAQETLQQHQALHNITNEASAVDNQEKAVEIIAHSLHQLRQNDRVVVFLMNDKNQLQVMASAGLGSLDLSNILIPIGQGVVGKVAASKRPHRIDDITTDPDYLEIDKETRSEMAVPILYGDQLLGVINIESPEAAAYDENDQEIIATLGTNLGTILANTRLVSEVRQQVERQQQLYEITSKIRRSVDIQTILRTFTTEVCNAMQARSAKVRITVASGGDDKENGNGHSLEFGQQVDQRDKENSV